MRKFQGPKGPTLPEPLPVRADKSRTRWVQSKSLYKTVPSLLYSRHSSFLQLCEASQAKGKVTGQGSLSECHGLMENWTPVLQTPAQPWGEEGLAQGCWWPTRPSRVLPISASPEACVLLVLTYWQISSTLMTDSPLSAAWNVQGSSVPPDNKLCERTHTKHSARKSSQFILFVLNTELPIDAGIGLYLSKEQFNVLSYYGCSRTSVQNKQATQAELLLNAKKRKASLACTEQPGSVFYQMQEANIDLLPPHSRSPTPSRLHHISFLLDDKDFLKNLHKH